MYIEKTYPHKPSTSVWKSTTSNGYAVRMAKVFDCFFSTGLSEIANAEYLNLRSKEQIKNRVLTDKLREAYNKCNPLPDIKTVADIGSGPWSGMFYLKTWPTMYAVDPSWKVYKEHKVIKKNTDIQRIDGFGDNFKLPTTCDLIWCINALNHGGCLLKALQNIMNHLNPGGNLLFHLHLRSVDSIDRGHPMPVLDTELDDFFKDYKIIHRDVLPDPLKKDRPKAGRMTYLARIEK